MAKTSKASNSVMRGEKAGAAKATKNMNLRALNAALTKELKAARAALGADKSSEGMGAARRRQNDALVGYAMKKAAPKKSASAPKKSASKPIPFLATPAMKKNNKKK